MITTKQDFENLLNLENSKKTAQEELQTLQDFDDRTVTRTIEAADPEDPESKDVVEEIENPHPLHKQKGFQEWMDVVRLNAETRGVKVSELCKEYTEDEIESAVVVLT